MLQRLIIIALVLTSSLSAKALVRSLSRQKALVVSTLNMKWYGIGGTMWNEPHQEYRQDNMKQFIDQELPDSDIIVFTEVVETNQLQELIKDRMDCATYEGGWTRHQHVMICYDKKQFRAEKYDNDFIIEEVDLGSMGLRPAAQAKICHKKGECFLQVIGVHLAAGREYEKRREQVSYINENLKKQSGRLPTVITGDFNSHIKAQSDLDEDDIEAFERILSQNLRPTFHSATKHIKTYGTGPSARAYDHIVVSKNIEVLSTWGYEACSTKPDLKKTFIPFQSFRKYFTDHCPVSAKISIK
jgi:endonuclease/exonuclease/phosphatase family metal-dependent hydrolase